MATKLLTFLDKETDNLQQAGLFRTALSFRSPQQDKLSVRSRKIINLSSSNYIGFANHPAIKAAAIEAIEQFGLGVASPRMIAGTQTIHERLERAVTGFLKTEDTILFGSGYHANTGFFESLFGDRDCIFCDSLCHPSIADGVRLSRANVFLYRNDDLGHLEDRLKRSRSARFRVIVTDGVFSLDGQIADLEGICALAKKYDALSVIDDSHGIGVLGVCGRGTHELRGVMTGVDMITGSFGNALGGGAGGFVSGRRQVISWLRQKSRPYLGSAALAPASATAGLKAIELLEEGSAPLETLHANVAWFRRSLTESGFELIEGEHPIVPIIVGNAVSAQRMVDQLQRRNVYTIGFCHPVVPEGKARIRAQISAEHSEKALQRVLQVFREAGQTLKLI